jgi:molybdopterin-containing oxidoreductase family iron-sulfur binding subunit
MTEANDIQSIRARLEGTRGRDYWRSLESVAETPEFKDFLHREFPQNASEWLDPVGRRGFLKLMSASLALAGVSACTRQPDEAIVPYVRQPEELVPGKPLFYATAMPFAGAGVGLLVENHEGRPTKIEGNPDHPSSLGATDVYAQAAILGLYDPDRSQTITRLGEIRPFDAFVGAMAGILSAQDAQQGRGIRVLSETVSSPTLASQIETFLGRFPQAKWAQWEPFGRHNAREGSRRAFGEYVDARYSVEKADVILSLDADFLCVGHGALTHARAYASRRRIEGDRAQFNRMYVVESSPTNTGTRADHRVSMRASEVEVFARAIAARLGLTDAGNAVVPEAARAWLGPLANDLQAARGRSLVIAGEGQPAAVHALAHAMNEALGNVGQTVVYTQTAEALPTDQRAGLEALVSEMNAGEVSLLVVLGGNPVYTAPASLNFAEAMGNVALRAHLGLYHDESAALCHWHIPEAHFLEAWSDVRAHDGTATIVQPLIAPLYDGKSVHEFVSALNAEGVRSGYDIVRSFWSGRAAGAGVPAEAPARDGLAALEGAAPSSFDRDWRRWLHDGVVPGSAFESRAVTVQPNALDGRGTSTPAGLEVVFRPDPGVYDGRFANNGWLQELPKALTKLTWDNAALVAPGTAQRLMLVSGDIVEIRRGERAIRIPVWLAPGHALDTITLHMGYGRERAGRVASGTGFSINELRTTDAPDILTGVEVIKTGDTYELVSTQDHWSLEGRNLVRVATVDEYERDPAFAAKEEHLPITGLTMLADRTYEGYAWGMTIDQNVCTGCNACVVACQAENNVPVVGKSQVANGREMHWLRIDRYYSGDVDDPDTYHQPMPCQQCEAAPCEVVCPVSATTHSDEGLNDMVYNRCVGTRYCSNNCPYKVRRFNFLLYSDFETASLKLARNPDVTVRSRGVMEKCTYCVQRINVARVAAKLEDREIRDGDVVTACQSACPTQAIVFGNLNDPQSAVSKTKASSLNYSLLAELNTRPRTTYMAIVRNPNAEMPAHETSEGGH